MSKNALKICEILRDLGFVLERRNSMTVEVSSSKISFYFKLHTYSNCGVGMSIGHSPHILEHQKPWPELGMTSQHWIRTWDADYLPGRERKGLTLTKSIAYTSM